LLGLRDVLLMMKLLPMIIKLLWYEIRFFFVINEYVNVPSFKNIFDIYYGFVYISKFFYCGFYTRVCRTCILLVTLSLQAFQNITLGHTNSSIWGFLTIFYGFGDFDLLLFLQTM
jgi:hypothetical protein